jgi:fimbrial chaperone protein
MNFLCNIFLKRIFHFFVAFTISLATVTLPYIAEAGNWRVSPIKINFDIKTRNEGIIVTNDGDQPLNLEVTAMVWSQDQQGQDFYKPANDLIFFPKKLVIEPKRERVIRAGIKVPAVDREKTYRLFIKDVPDRSQAAPNTVAIAIQFGVPVFVKPIEEKIVGAIVDTQLADGALSACIENRGNSHFRVKSITLSGKTAAGEPLFTQELNGWYLLNGSSRIFSITLPEAACRQINSLDIKVQSDQIELNERIDVDPTMCPAT